VFRFHLSFRDLQDLLTERGIVISEAIHQWRTKFGTTYAAGLRHGSSNPQQADTSIDRRQSSTPLLTSGWSSGKWVACAGAGLQHSLRSVPARGHGCAPVF
jgi:hypothetical protein